VDIEHPIQPEENQWNYKNEYIPINNNSKNGLNSPIKKHGLAKWV
jgi:hypothetical protein